MWPGSQKWGVCLSFREKGGEEGRGENSQEREGRWLLAGTGKMPPSGIRKIPEQVAPVSAAILPPRPRLPIPPEPR